MYKLDVKIGSDDKVKPKEITGPSSEEFTKLTEEGYWHMAQGKKLLLYYVYSVVLYKGLKLVGVSFSFSKDN